MSESRMYKLTEKEIRLKLDGTNAEERRNVIVLGLEDVYSKHGSENQLDADYGDSLWCVIDKDKWPQDQIEELHAFCNQKSNRHLVISNPSIEIWLLYHKLADLTGLSITTAQDAKRALDIIEKGGYYYIKYLPLMMNAIENASRADTKPGSYMPELLQTKVYLLGKALYERMGKVRFDKFVASLPMTEKEFFIKNKQNNNG